MVAMQSNGYLRVFANIHNARFQYSQRFLLVFAIFEILPNEMREESISSYKKKYSQKQSKQKQNNTTIKPKTTTTKARQKQKQADQKKTMCVYICTYGLV